MIHKQQMGYEKKDIAYGLCQALVRNYLNDLSKGKEIETPIIFQGGVAFNKGIVRAFEENLKVKVVIPPHHEALGAIGVALMAVELSDGNRTDTSFKGFNICSHELATNSFECRSCSKLCEVTQLVQNDRVIARWGAKCQLWEGTDIDQKN
jgi:sugar (pentulose or hexulose) kinase